jgi:hypothetical protein
MLFAEFEGGKTRHLNGACSRWRIGLIFKIVG